MGIKDNFSQAVKELWKKDGQEEQATNSAAAGAKPSELEQYLQQQQQDTAPQPAPEQTAPAQQNTAQVPPIQQNAPQQNTFAQQPAQPSQSDPAAAQAAPAGQPNQNVNNTGVPLETPYYRNPSAQQAAAPANGYAQNAAAGYGAQAMGTAPAYGAQPNMGGYNANSGFGGGFVPPAAGDGSSAQEQNETDEVTVISKNTVIDGNVRSLANMQIDGNIKGNVETTRNIDMSGKIVGDIACNNAGMTSAAMQGNVSLKGRIRMDRDTILIGDLTSQYADINGRIRGKLDIAGKAELKRDAIVFGDINASTIAVTDGAIIQGYVNTTFLSKEDSRNAIPEAITFDSKESSNS